MHGVPQLSDHICGPGNERAQILRTLDYRDWGVLKPCERLISGVCEETHMLTVNPRWGNTVPSLFINILNIRM